MARKNPRGEFKGFRLRKRNDVWSYEIRLNAGTKRGSFPLGTSKPEAKRLAYIEYEKVAKRNLPSYQSDQLNKQTLEELIDGYIKEGTESNSGYIGGIFKIKQSFEKEKEILNRFKRDNKTLVSKKLGQLTSDDFQAYIEKRLNQGRPASTILRQLNPVWFVVGRYAKKLKKLPMPDLRDGVIFPEEKNAPGICLTHEQEDQILRWLNPTPRLGSRQKHSTVTRRQWSLLVEMALETGVRLNGLLMITWGDIDWRNYKYSQPPEKRSPRRDLPLTYRMVQQLKRWKERVPEQCRQSDSTLFFASRGKNKWGKMDNDAASTFFSLLCDEAGLPDVTFHDLRHTSRTRMAELGLLSFERDYMHGVLKGRYEHEYIPAIRDKIDPHWRKLVENEQPKQPEQQRSNRVEELRNKIEELRNKILGVSR